MAARALLRGLAIVAAAAALLWVPLPAIPGACVTVKNVLITLGAVLSLGKVLYDTLFSPRYQP